MEPSNETQRTTGTIIKLLCPYCGTFSDHPRRMVSVDFLNDARLEIEKLKRKIEQLEGRDR